VVGFCLDEIAPGTTALPVDHPETYQSEIGPKSDIAQHPQIAIGGDILLEIRADFGRPFGSAVIASSVAFQAPLAWLGAPRS
jgi:hypothetical protein